MDTLSPPLGVNTQPRSGATRQSDGIVLARSVRVRRRVRALAPVVLVGRVESNMTRYVVIGAGAIGGAIAGLLAETGSDVVAVARGAHAATIIERGLTVRMPERSFTVPVRCVTRPSELTLGLDDVLLLSTKTHQAESALRQWVDTPVVDGSATAGTAGELLPILTALNGVSSEGMALRFFDRVVGVCVWMPAVHLEPGEVIVRGTPLRGTFHLGTVPADRDESVLLDGIERDWTAAGFRIVRPDDVMPWKYRKLVSNIGNAFQALVGANGSTGALVAAAQDEARTVLDAARVEVTDDATEAAERAESGLRIEDVPGQPNELGGSSWQSLARGTGDIETDYLNGEIALIARRNGIEAPINAGISRLARQAAAVGRPPGSISSAELARALGL